MRKKNRYEKLLAFIRRSLSRHSEIDRKASGWKGLIDQTKTDARAWIAEPGAAALVEADRCRIDEDMRSGSPAAHLNIADSLCRISTWLAVSGQVALLDGNAGGWTDIHRAWLYRSLALRLRVSEFQKGRVLGEFRPTSNINTQASDCAWALAYGLVVGREYEVRLFTEVIRVMLVDNAVVTEHYWQHSSRGIEYFMLRLSGMLGKEKFDVPEAPAYQLPPYQDILASWNDTNDLSIALYRACDFHCQRLSDKSRPNEEFRRPPYNLVPVEILAVCEVRRVLGLHTPQVDHPLLVAPFDLPMGSPSDVNDDLLKRVEAGLNL